MVVTMKDSSRKSDLVPRRTQFSSCDSCRKSRVACDALKRRSNPSSSDRDACSRCSRKNRPCTFEWIEKFNSASQKESAREDSAETQQSSPHASQVTTSSPQFGSSTGIPDHSSTTSIYEEGTVDHFECGAVSENERQANQYVDGSTASWLRCMYEEGFEAVFGSWIGNYSCPYTFEEMVPSESRPRRHTPPTLSHSVTKLCRRMDEWMQTIGCGLTASPEAENGATPWNEVDNQIELSLSLGTQAFSARWLPITAPGYPHEQPNMDLVESLWRDIRRDLLRVINRPCYRSVITLLLFALTPMPSGITSEEEGNGLSAALCVHGALQQVQMLRARQKSIEFNGSKISNFPTRQATASSPDGVAAADFIDIESTLYWAALTFDTSASLTMSFKPILSPGLLGFKSEPCWHLVRSTTTIFHEQTESWRTQGVEITESTSNRIIAAAASWKLLIWKMTAMLKEALREGQEEETVQWAFNETVEAIVQFDTTYRSLLAACERRIQFLGQHTKLRWYELMLHYHLAILIATDAVQVAGRNDLTEQLRIYRADAEGNVLNCLMFGLNNRFQTDRPGRSLLQQPPITVPLISIDPYPHHVVAATQFLWKTLDRDTEDGRLPPTEASRLRSILLQILELLPQTSKSILAATNKARQAMMSNVS